MRRHRISIPFWQYNGNLISADPGLCQGRGGAWDHRRCGTWLSGRKQRHTPSRQHLCQLHAPAIYMPLPFARPQTLQTLRRPPRQQPLPATCPCHLLFRGFKTAVCPASNPPNASVGLQGNNSYSYMPLPSVFQGVPDCRLPGLKPPKRFRRFRRPPRQQLLQLHAPAICFSGGSSLPFAWPQTLQTLRQASKATTLTATCPCHLFVRGFKPAVCPASNPPNASASLQGNNSYSYYMPLPSVFQGVQDCRLPGLKPPKRFQPFRRPPRQQLLQLHALAICFSGGSRLLFARPQTPQTLPKASKATTLTATTCPCHLFFRGFKTAVCPASNPPNASDASAGLQGNNSYSYMPLPSVFQEVQDCRLPALKPSKRFRRPPRQQLLQLHAPAICFSGGSRLPFARPQTPQTLPTLPQASKATTLTYSYMPLPSVFQGVQDCRLPGFKPPRRFQPFRRPPRQQLLQLHAPAICFSGGSRLPFARPQTPQTLPTLPQASKATTLTATAIQLHARAICFSGGSRLPFARPHTPQTLPTLPQASKATTLTATCPCHLFFRRFKTAVCPASNPPNASAGLQGNNSYSYMPLPSVFQGVQDCRLPGLTPPKRFQPFPRPPRQQLLQLHAPAICFSRGFKTAVCPASNPPNASAGLQGNNSYSYMPLPSAFQGVQTAVCPASNPPNASDASAGLQGNSSYSYMPLPSVFQEVQHCRLPGLKPPKRFCRPPRQQLLQLHAPAICFSGGSRLPFARPQTLQTLPQASKATTLTATCQEGNKNET